MLYRLWQSAQRGLARRPQARSAGRFPRRTLPVISYFHLVTHLVFASEERIELVSAPHIAPSPAASSLGFDFSSAPRRVQTVSALESAIRCGFGGRQEVGVGLRHGVRSRGNSRRDPHFPIGTSIAELLDVPSPKRRTQVPAYMHRVMADDYDCLSRSRRRDRPSSTCTLAVAGAPLPDGPGRACPDEKRSSSSAARRRRTRSSVLGMPPARRTTTSRSQCPTGAARTCMPSAHAPTQIVSGAEPWLGECAGARPRWGDGSARECARHAAAIPSTAAWSAGCSRDASLICPAREASTPTPLMPTYSTTRRARSRARSSSKSSLTP